MKAEYFLKTFAVAGFAMMLTAAMVPIAKAEDAGQLPPASKKSNVTYQADIKPMLEPACFKCHGEEKQKSGLRLDSAEAILKGAKREKVVVVGNSAKSELVKAVAHTSKDEDHYMPPKGKGDRLTPEQIGLIRAWIDQGAR